MNASLAECTKPNPTPGNESAGWPASEASNQKVVAVVGPTSAGKSDIAVAIAAEFGGEVISADSRQIYKGLVIGTGAVQPDPYPPRHSDDTKRKNLDHIATHKDNTTGSFAELRMTGFIHQNIPHHMIGVVDPKKQYSVAEYQYDAGKVLRNVLSRGKLPIIEGGTGQYVDALLYEESLPAVPPQPALREKLGKKSAEQLFQKLKQKDPRRAKTIDPRNKRRLIRALEIIEMTGKPVPPRRHPSGYDGRSKKESTYDILKLGIKVPPQELRKRIQKRLHKRLEEGLIKEVEQLHHRGLSWERMEQLGLEYRWVSRYLRDKVAHEKMIERLEQKIWQYAKRQMTWFRRDPDIIWIDSKQQALERVRAFICDKKNAPASCRGVGGRG